MNIKIITGLVFSLSFIFSTFSFANGGSVGAVSDSSMQKIDENSNISQDATTTPAKSAQDDQK
ncbi:hypothetical protein [Legionella sp. km772]|uniref:hypothetical protein n=1 Tax=Legionella sp. km772 TaxID=2498111 RepID=UPI000F8DE352|nr:hypothetical protein [Legionella sp. km772]RUR12309.1 hypothetical protein ELY15_05560 [Legionella sp. km772]